jgi:hypothetical protein
MKNPVYKLTLTALTAVLSSLALAQPLKDLAGEWMFGALSFTSYRDAYTGKLSDDGGGIGDKIKINPDGTYERAARMKMTLYTCTTIIAIWERGMVQTGSQTISFRPKEGAIRSEDNCNAKFNYQKPVSAWSRGYSVGRDAYNRVLLYLKADDGSVTNYVRELKAGF